MRQFPDNLDRARAFAVQEMAAAMREAAGAAMFLVESGELPPEAATSAYIWHIPQPGSAPADYFARAAVAPLEAHFGNCDKRCRVDKPPPGGAWFHRNDKGFFASYGRRDLEEMLSSHDCADSAW